MTDSTRGVIGKILGEIQEPKNSSRIYTIEINHEGAMPNLERYVELIGKFIEHIQSTSDTEIRISISLDKTIPELFYDQLIEKLKRRHVDTAIKSLKESKIILICE